MTGAVVQRYEERIRLGQIEPDAAQQAAVIELDRLERALAEWWPASWVCCRSSGASGVWSARALPAWRRRARQDHADGPVLRGRRLRARSGALHFHEFMAEVHERIARRAQDACRAIRSRTSPQTIAAEARLLCFDELHVTDIADAMILGRLFKGLFERARWWWSRPPTCRPRELYKNGLNRQLFLPFIDLIERAHGRAGAAGRQGLPAREAGGPAALLHAGRRARRDAEMDRIWSELTGSIPGAPIDLDVKGRKLRVPQAAMGVARFSLRRAVRAAARRRSTILHIAHAFHTLLIDGIPLLSTTRSATWRAASST